MHNAEFREVTLTDAQRPARPGLPAAEPSHIHVPRPSRRVPPVATHRDDEASLPVHLECILKEAA